MTSGKVLYCTYSNIQPNYYIHTGSPASLNFSISVSIIIEKLQNAIKVTDLSSLGLGTVPNWQVSN